MIKMNLTKLRQKNSKTYLWIVLNNMLRATKNVICDTRLELIIREYIQEKTFGFLKLKEKFYIDHFMEETGSGPKAIYKVLARLVERGVILKFSDGGYCFNLLGIISLYKDIYGDYYESDDGFNMEYALAKRLLVKEGIENLRILSVDREKKVKLKETVKLNLEKRVKEKAKRREITMQKELKCSTDVQAYTRELCNDFNVQGNTKVKWTKIERHQATQWVQDCYDIGEDPKEILNEVCEHWPRLVARVKSKSGYALLSDVFFFPEFYKYKKAVMAELALGKVKEKMKVKMIQL